MKLALVFQARTNEDLMKNIQAPVTGEYVPFSKMEFATCVPISDGDTATILEKIFSDCNGDFMCRHLNYSMSVGDIVVIYDKTYRCGASDWEEITLNAREQKLIAEIYAEIRGQHEMDVEEDMEENEMETNKTAQDIVGAAKDGLKSASETALGLCKDVEKEAKAIAAMSQQEAENHIRRKFHTNANKFIDWMLDKLGLELERSEEGDDWFSPVDETIESEDTNRLKKAIADFKAVKNAGEKKGWKKFIDLMKAVFGIIFATFIEVAKVVLKLAFALTVGVIRVGACTLTTLFSCASIIGNDIVKPTGRTIKRATKEHNARKAARNVGVEVIIEDDCFEE